MSDDALYAYMLYLEPKYKGTGVRQRKDSDISPETPDSNLAFAKLHNNMSLIEWAHAHFEHFSVPSTHL